MPDGLRLMFLTLRDGDQQEIYSMAIDGSDPINLTHDPARDVLAEMSPDGRQIAYASDRTGDREIWVMNADGSDPSGSPGAPAMTPTRPGPPMGSTCCSPPTASPGASGRCAVTARSRRRSCPVAGLRTAPDPSPGHAAFTQTSGLTLGRSSQSAHGRHADDDKALARSPRS